MEDRMNRLETMMVDMMAMMKEIWARSSTVGPSQPIASTTTPAQPPTDPRRRTTTKLKANQAIKEGLI
ncbi:UNVERIFIED_CONTAM: hypothetical protein Slati_0818100 [Sesamum latifolium]|uniref:Uncharacterized protein n=1 Tax=Sesamum latifolium TaxID=2727402 RepID=A0AAW2XKX0_9LAMI